MNKPFEKHDGAPSPWYHHLWPWLLIAVPLLSVMIASGVTLWLALSHEDPLVIEPRDYNELRRELRAQDVPAAPEEGEATPQGDG